MPEFVSEVKDDVCVGRKTETDRQTRKKKPRCKAPYQDVFPETMRDGAVMKGNHLFAWGRSEKMPERLRP